MTYRKLAQLIGVSPSTVSKVLSGSGEISEDTAVLVRKAAAEYGVVRPKYHRTHKSKRVTVIVPEIVSVYYSTMATMIADYLSKRGFETSIMICGFEHERFFELFDIIVNEKLADGIISFESCEVTHKSEIPVIFLGSSGNKRCDSVEFDVESGIDDAVKHLISLGHRHIGYIGEKNTTAKLDYFKNVMIRNGLTFSPRDCFVSSQRFEMIGVEGAEYFVKSRNCPTAFLAAYDEVAFGAIHTFGQYGKRVPEDISIIGINDIPSSAYAQIPLTTIRTFSDEMVTAAADLLIKKIESEEPCAVQKIKLCCDLIIRDTTALKNN